ncbi:hypothetical protein MSG28_008014 [Choristoneura fumiferana]|uniref:Uncharacterized protein n=1 Tax=Choristoneura fumiferana TaxID=7141 RepID=A0ACC0J9M4_CHOFU|nr:hypothetical protein MSG28_008014 [Choristoneura fumiferana]
MSGFSVLFYSLFLLSTGSTLRIIGGHEAPSKFGYYHASLQNLTGSHVCGGAVVSERHVVTAAHCVQGTEPQYIKIVVGTTNLDEGGKQYDVEAIKIYNDFNFSERANDIAMLKISEAFNLNDIEIIKLDENYLNENDTVILTGFGAVQTIFRMSKSRRILNDLEIVHGLEEIFGLPDDPHVSDDNLESDERNFKILMSIRTAITGLP